MKYCENCKRLTSFENKCMRCGEKNVREPQENDSVYFSTLQYPYAGMLEDVLTQHDVPHHKQGKLGAGMVARTGTLGTEQFDFFVPFGKFDEAKELYEELFAVEEKDDYPPPQPITHKTLPKRLKIWSKILYTAAVLFAGLGICSMILAIINDGTDLELPFYAGFILFMVPGVICAAIAMSFPKMIEYYQREREKYLEEKYSDEEETTDD